jgi:hypothetical protein
MATRQSSNAAPVGRPISERPLLVLDEVIELTRLSDKRVAWPTADVYAWLNKTWVVPAAEAA